MLLSIVKAYLNAEAVDFPKDISYPLLCSMLKSHNLSAIAYCVAKNSNNEHIPSEALKTLENAFYDVVMRYSNQTSIIDELDSILTKNKIRHTFFKGAQIREYFPVPEARAMGDIDVLIDEENRGLVKDILTENGFNLINSNGPVYDYSKNNMLVEMHSKIINGKVGNSNAEKCFLDAMEHCSFDNYHGTLDINYHFAYLLTHIAHHFWFYGAGVKMILDLAVLLKQFDIDLDIVLAKMEEIGLCDFSKVIISICYKWFGYGNEYISDTAKTEAFLLGFGAFGNANRNKAAVVTRKELEENKKPSSFSTRLRLLFPSYKKLKDIPYMKFMEGRPYLIVFGWIYRIFYNLKNKKAFVKDVNDRLNSDETKIEAQDELQYFKEIGLL